MSARGIVKGVNGSVTQIPILTMPNDDITHPIPDLTGYITEGQIVLDRELNGQSVYPPINVLTSLSRLMKDGIGEGYTGQTTRRWRTSYSPAMRKWEMRGRWHRLSVRMSCHHWIKSTWCLAGSFEHRFVGQDPHDNRNIITTLNIGWQLLGLLPKEELDRIDTKDPGAVL